MQTSYWKSAWLGAKEAPAEFFEPIKVLGLVLMASVTALVKKLFR